MQISYVFLQASIHSNMHGHEDAIGLIDSPRMPYDKRFALRGYPYPPRSPHQKLPVGA